MSNPKMNPILESLHNSINEATSPNVAMVDIIGIYKSTKLTPKEVADALTDIDNNLIGRYSDIVTSGKNAPFIEDLFGDDIEDILFRTKRDPKDILNCLTGRLKDKADYQIKTPRKQKNMIIVPIDGPNGPFKIEIYLC